MTDALQQHLLAALQEVPATALCVAFSGGPDSTALLHALAHLPAARARGLRALHVDHGLQANSAAWAEQCQQFCATLALPCEVLRVQVNRGNGDGLESAARHARYDALAAQLHDDEWLALGHHRDDQVETVLLKLLRGAGPEGLGGMRTVRPLGRGQLWRPLLGWSRAQLHDYIAQHQLHCIDDPSNTDTQLARNYLRREILPRLTSHWPQTATSILHTAALSRAAADSLRTHWLDALERLHDPSSGSLEAAGWLALQPALREPLLDHWLHARGRSAPTTAQRQQIERQLREALPGRVPCIRWPGTELHIWGGRLWALPPSPTIDPHWQVDWYGEPLRLPDGGALRLQDDTVHLSQPVTVRLRRGGERIKPAGDPHTRELRDLFQQARIPPWQRLACPLLYVDDELVAVADRWISARGIALLAPTQSRLCWQPAR